MATTRLGLEDLKKKATAIRRKIIEITTEAGSGHPTSSLSATEVVTALYFGGFVNLDQNHPRAADRDRFLLSKGHAVPVQYAALCEAGFFTLEEIMTLRKLGSPFEGHPSYARGLPGIEASTGSLGQGLSVGMGIALALRLDEIDAHVYVMTGDGEMGEGQVWEAIASAPHYETSNLTMIIDQNGYQQTGSTASVMDLTPFAPKIESFGWHTQTINGNDMGEVVGALETAQSASDRPSCIVSETQKGFGILPLLQEQGDLNMHGKPLPPDLEEKALALLA